jgi:hypothetical protein
MSSETFNTIEGVFWIVLGIAVFCAFFMIPRRYKALAAFASAVLILFGASDFMQVLYGTFLVSGMEWLLVWKVVNLAALIGAVVWYVVLRARG